MEIITKVFGLILLCGGVASAQIVQQNSNGGLSKTASDSAYFNIPTESSAATMTGPLTLAGSSLTVQTDSLGLGINTNSTTKNFVVVASSVGVGRLNPLSRLHLHKIGNPTLSLANSMFYFNDAGAGFGLVGQANNASPYQFYLQNMNDAGSSYFPIDLNPLGGAVNVPSGSFSVGGSTLVVSGGKVGIGVADPESALEVKGAGTTQIIVNGNGGGSAGLIFRNNDVQKWNTYSDGSGYNLNWYAADQGVRMSLTQAGNLGIGLTDPTAKLVVNGNIVSSGTLTTTGNVGIGTSAPARTLSISGGAGTGFIQVTNNTGGVASGDGGYMSHDGTHMLIGNQEVGNVSIFTRNTTDQGLIITTLGSGASNASLTMKVSAATGGALCLNASNVLSKCTSAVDASGNCTCP